MKKTELEKMQDAQEAWKKFILAFAHKYIPMKFLLRFKAAWYAFRLQPLEIIFDDWHLDAHTKPYECDNQPAGCRNAASQCWGRTRLNIQIENNDHKHICKPCADERLFYQYQYKEAKGDASFHFPKITIKL